MKFEITEEEIVNAIKQHFKEHNQDIRLESFNNVLNDCPIRLFSADPYTNLSVLHYGEEKHNETTIRYDGFIAIPYHLFLKKSD